MLQTLDALFKMSLEEAGVLTTCNIVTLERDDVYAGNVTAQVSAVKFPEVSVRHFCSVCSVFCAFATSRLCPFSHRTRWVI
jgi:hypothetical protein